MHDYTKSDKLSPMSKEPAIPPSYDHDIAAEILDKLAGNATALKTILNEDKRYPSDRTFYNWLEKVKGFRDKYALAREMQARTLVDKAIEESADRTNDRIENKESRKTKNGTVVNGTNTRPDTANVLRSRLIVDTYFKAAALFNPREFAVKNKLEIGADVELTPTISVKMGGSGEQAKQVEPELPDVEVLDH